MTRALALAILAALAIAGCGAGSDVAQARARFVAERTGGIAGVHDRLVVRPSGAGRYTDRDGHVVRLTPAATRALRGAVREADFASLRREYRPQIGVVSDAFEYRLRYDGNTVVVQQGAEGVPQRLQRVLRESTALIDG